MAAKDLFSLSQATNHLAGAGSINNSTLSAIITSVSDAIIKYCRRDFNSKTYDELYNGQGTRHLLLREYPIQSVQSVRYRPVTVVKIINGTTANTAARVTVTQVGLTLTRMNAGNLTSDSTALFATYPTLISLVNYINTLGNGWTAQIVGDAGGDYGVWPSADLFVMPSFQNQTATPTSQGALTARGVYAELKMHTYELAGYQFDPRGWLLRAIPYTDPELLHPEDLVWSPGINNFRIQYTAGYTVVPEAVAEAGCQWAAELYYRTIRDPSLSSQTLTSQNWGQSSPNTFGKPPYNVQILIDPYRRYSIGTNQG
jgi:hypothetical protein